MDKKTQTFLSSLTYLRRRLAFAAALFCSLILPVISARTNWSLSQQEVQGKSSSIQDKNAQRTEERKRRENERPSDIIQLIGVLPGMKIGEVGAGTGYFTFFLSERVGESGIVYANEINREALVELESHAKESGALKNIVTVLAPEDDPSFPSRDLDMIVSYNSFHDIKNKDIWLRNAVKYLKPKGTLAIIDGYWPEHGGLTLDKLRDYGAQVGFRLFLHKDFSSGERSHHVHLFERDR
jgi:ubiquinone/menaquinone biosynthesis C-methylase UbiE